MSDTNKQPANIGKIILFRQQEVGADPAEFNTVMNKAGFPKDAHFVDMDTHVGIEVEVERVFREGNIGSFYHTARDITYHVWSNTTDGSLRNNGREFVSMPVKGREISYALNLLHDTLTRDKQCVGHEFTPRTSVHVHMNVRDLTVDQLANLILLYALVEPLIFSIENTNRDKSIFCVPWHESNVINHLHEFMMSKDTDRNRLGRLSHWYKYTGLNLRPVTNYGTVEFRHMKGTADIETLTNWINIILSLKKYAKKIKSTKLKDRLINLNTTSEYSAIVREIFGRYADSFQAFDLQKILETTSSNIKEMFVNTSTDIIPHIMPEDISPLVYIDKPNKYMDYLMKHGLVHKRNKAQIRKEIDRYLNEAKDQVKTFKNNVQQYTEAIRTETSKSRITRFKEDMQMYVDRIAYWELRENSLNAQLIEIANNKYIPDGAETTSKPKKSQVDLLREVAQVANAPDEDF